MEKLEIHRLLLTLILTTLIGGCSNSASEEYYPIKPPELKDCKIYRLNNDNGARITIARCPNSTTTTNYQSGKTTASVVVVDGVEYVERESDGKE